MEEKVYFVMREKRVWQYVEELKMHCWVTISRQKVSKNRREIMENVFKEWAAKRNYLEWDKHNRMDFNHYYHDELREMEDAINGISFIYHDYCCEGWPNHKYSCVL